MLSAFAACVTPDKALYPSYSLTCFEMFREDFRIYQQLNFGQLNSQLSKTNLLQY